MLIQWSINTLLYFLNLESFSNNSQKMYGLLLTVYYIRVLIKKWWNMKKILLGLILFLLYTTLHGQALLESTGSPGEYNIEYPAVMGTAVPQGFMFTFRAHQNSTGPSQLSVNGLTPYVIRKNGSLHLGPGDIKSGSFVTVIFDGSNWQMLSVSSNASATPSEVIQNQNLVNQTANFRITGESAIGTSLSIGKDNAALANNPNKLEIWSGDASGLEYLRGTIQVYARTNDGGAAIWAHANQNGTDDLSDHWSSGALAAYETTKDGTFDIGVIGRINPGYDGWGGFFIKADNLGDAAPRVYLAGGANNAAAAFMAGNVGIGTYDPLATLHVSGTLRVEGIGGPGLVYANASGDFSIASGSYVTSSATTGFIPRMVSGISMLNSPIQTDGTWTRIGGTPSANYLFRVDQTSNTFPAIYGESTVANGNAIWGYNSNNSANASGVRGVAVGQGNAVYADNTNIAGYALYATGRGYFGGNVGIGATTPNAPLQFSNALVNRKIVLLETANNDHQFHGLGVNTNLFRLQTDATTSDFAFYASTSASTSNELMRIRGNGNVGIGVANPTTSLAIIGALTIDNANSNDGTNAALPTSGIRLGNTNAIGISSRKTAGANQNGIDFWTSSNIRMQIQSTGNVSIGGDFTAAARLHQDPVANSAHYHKFTINSTGKAVSDGFDVGIDNSGNAEIRQRENLTLSIFTNDLERLTILNNGRIGIGTSAPGSILGASNYLTLAHGPNYSGSAYSSLEMVGSRNGVNSEFTRFEFVNFNTPVPTFENSARISAFSGNSVVGHGQLVFYTNNGTLTEKMRLSEAGRLGIGVNPSTNLAQLQISDLANSSGQIRLWAGTATGETGTDGLLINMGATGASIQNYETGSLQFGTGGSAVQMTLSPTGNLGLRTGVFTPASKLSVDGGVSVGNTYFGTAAPTNGMIVQGNVGIGTSSPATQLHLNNTISELRLQRTDDVIGKAVISFRADVLAAASPLWEIGHTTENYGSFYVRHSTNGTTYTNRAGFGVGPQPNFYVGRGLTDNILSVGLFEGVYTNTDGIGGAFVDVSNSFSGIGGLSGIRFKSLAQDGGKFKAGILFSSSDATNGTGDLILANNNLTNTTNARVVDAAITIKPNKHVGIATTNPSASLDVDGSFKLGSSGTVLQRLQYATTTTSASFGNVAANSSLNVNFNMPGISTSDKIWCSSAGLVDGLVIQACAITAANSVSIRVRNVTGTAISLSGQDFNVIVLRP